MSYCLVIYFQNVKSYRAGILTALSNRVGDVALLIAIAWILNYGRWSYIFYLEIIIFDCDMKIIGILVILAAITKRAQIPFSSWLPAAIAAPTPVSALVHSSTLVTAGIYLLIRFNFLINNFITGFVLLLLGRLTILISGLGANFEIDLKKIIALSTLRQLGLIIRILSLGFYKLAFFHLLSHALFKALLFLCAGAFIHNIMNFQDIRLSGNFFNQIPLTSTCFNVSSLALCGMPFLAGFYSKDLILEIVCIRNLNFLIFSIFFISTGLTVSYSFRLIFNTSTISIRGFTILILRDERWVILKIIVVLGFISIIGGRILSWLIFPYPYFIILPVYLKFLTIFVCLLGGGIGYFIFRIFNLFKINYFTWLYYIKGFISIIWFMPFLSTLELNYYFLFKGYLYSKNFDFGWRELFGGYYLYRGLKLLGIYYQKLQNNQLKNIFLRYLIWLIIIIYFIFLYLNSLFLEFNIEDIKEIF